MYTRSTKYYDSVFGLYHKLFTKIVQVQCMCVWTAPKIRKNTARQEEKTRHKAPSEDHWYVSWSLMLWEGRLFGSRPRICAIIWARASSTLWVREGNYITLIYYSWQTKQLMNEHKASTYVDAVLKNIDKVHNCLHKPLWWRWFAKPQMVLSHTLSNGSYKPQILPSNNLKNCILLNNNWNG